jgi:hypothetical protein
MFSNSELRFGAFAGAVALVLVLALTLMAFTALEPGPRSSSQSDWVVSLSQPEASVVPTF